MAEEESGQQEELFTRQLWKETRNLPNFTNFAVSLQDETEMEEYQTMERVREGLFIFYRIFAFLEDAKERLKMPEYDKLFVHESLFKKQAFEDDLTYHLGEKEMWQDMYNDQRVQKYLEHLGKLEREDPKRLLAYVYHLYYALLSGGIILDMKRKLEEEKYYDVPPIKTDFFTEMNEITEDMTEEDKICFLAQVYREFKKKNVKDFHTDKMMECTGEDEIPQIRFSEALNEISMCFTEDEKMALLDESNILYVKDYMYDYAVITVMDFAGADISQIKNDFRAAMNEIAENLTEDEKMALLVESHNVFELNNSLVNNQVQSERSVPQEGQGQPKGVCCII